jgi:hypothetical protein
MTIEIEIEIVDVLKEKSKDDEEEFVNSRK